MTHGERIHRNCDALNELALSGRCPPEFRYVIAEAATHLAFAATVASIMDHGGLLTEPKPAKPRAGVSA